jgi:hypothetical protein
MFMIALSVVVTAVFIGIYIHSMQPIFKVPDCEMKRQYMQLKREELVFVIIECGLLSVCFCSQNIKTNLNNYLFFGALGAFIVVMLVFRAYMAKLWVCPRCGRLLAGVGTFWVDIKPMRLCSCGYEFYPDNKRKHK